MFIGSFIVISLFNFIIKTVISLNHFNSFLIRVTCDVEFWCTVVILIITIEWKNGYDNEIFKLSYIRYLQRSVDDDKVRQKRLSFVFILKIIAYHLIL